MKFYENQLFHIYNQGNNRQPIFFTDDNYEYFLWKMRAYLLPFGDVIVWSLMPNHFHWLFYVRKIEVDREVLRKHVDKIEYQRRRYKYGEKAKSVDRTWMRVAKNDKPMSLQEAIGTLERTYTRAINKENGWSGSLLREKCKAKDGFIDEFITLKKANGKIDYRFLPGTDFAYQCIIYIHENATVAGLVSESIAYKWSSARDYAGLRNGTLCNLEMGREIIDFY